MVCDERKIYYTIRKREIKLGGICLKAIKYLSAQEISDSWGITKRRVQNLCVNNRIPGAVRIGNMWAIPADASKPKDARMREIKDVTISKGALIRKTRRYLKAIVDTAMMELREKGLSHIASLQTLIVFFSSKLLDVYIDDDKECLNVCEHFFRCCMHDSFSDEVIQSIEKFISKNGMYLDDSLSWVYQFGTKKSSEFKYKDTQFFTEKYMINALVDSLQIDLDSKVIDKTTPRLLQSHTIENAVKPPFLGGFFISGISAVQSKHLAGWKRTGAPPNSVTIEMLSLLNRAIVKM